MCNCDFSELNRCLCQHPNTKLRSWQVPQVISHAPILALPTSTSANQTWPLSCFSTLSGIMNSMYTGYFLNIILLRLVHTYVYSYKSFTLIAVEYFIVVCGLPFHFLNITFWRVEILVSNKSNNTSVFFNGV